jgi:hypothetical protein
LDDEKNSAAQSSVNEIISLDVQRTFFEKDVENSRKVKI